MTRPNNSTAPASHKPALRLNARFLLRLGSTVVFLLMLRALLDLYRIQVGVSGPPMPDQERYLEEEKILARIRRSLSQSQAAARDFLLSPWPDRAAVYASEVQRTEHDAMFAIDELEKTGASRHLAPQLRAQIRASWATLEKLSGWTDDMRSKRGYDFLREKLPLARRSVNQILREMEEMNQKWQKKMAADLAASRLATLRGVSLSVAAAIALGLILASLNLAYTRDLERESIRKLEEIARAKSEMEQLSARLLNGQEEERRRLSRELHDGIGQTLTALQVEISHYLLQRGQTQSGGMEPLERARALTQEAMRTIRDISLLLRPSLLDDLGLEAALLWQAEEFHRRTGILCSFSAVGLQEHLPDDWNTCIYRIVQEALHNCEKHAAPTQVHMRIRQELELLTVDVEDDGVGFQLNGEGTPLYTAGLGILGMRERAAMLGGTVVVESAPGRGTRLSAGLPLARITAPAVVKGAQEAAGVQPVEA